MRSVKFVSLWWAVLTSTSCSIDWPSNFNSSLRNHRKKWTSATRCSAMTNRLSNIDCRSILMINNWLMLAIDLIVVQSYFCMDGWIVTKVLVGGCTGRTIPRCLKHPINIRSSLWTGASHVKFNEQNAYWLGFISQTDKSQSFIQVKEQNILFFWLPLPMSKWLPHPWPRSFVSWSISLAPNLATFTWLDSGDNRERFCFWKKCPPYEMVL